jgi:tRNA A-37 threonylcarbamoyl transferase component Bud32
MRSVETGTLVAGFRVESVLGSGAMGTVYVAERVGSRERVALKLLAPELALDERFRQRFLRESQLAASLEHPNAVPIVASGEEDGILYLAMARVEGADLRETLRREGRLEPERALRVVGQIARALDAAHAAGLVHRDVKPGNILVAEDGDGEHAYICDFGLARHVSSASSLTGDRGFVGTIDYVPPEQIAGRPLDGRADVYSLGCVLYECLAGRRPFDRESELAVVFAHLNEPPPALSDVRPELPRAFDAVFTKALAKSPADRYSTCGELVEAARAALQGKVLPSQRRRRRLVVVAAALAAAVAAATGGILATRGGHASLHVNITPTSIAGAQLGLKWADYKRIYGPGWRQDVFTTPGFPVLIFQLRYVSVYFTKRKGRAVEMTTWNRDYKTSKGIGPCSTIKQLKQAYGSALKPSPHNIVKGKAYAYIVGHMIFGANGKPPNPSKTVTAIGIYRGISEAYAGYVVLNEPSCA